MGESFDLKPDEFPSRAKLDEPKGKERLHSRVLEVLDFRTPQRIVLTLFVGSAHPIPSTPAKLNLESLDEKVAVTTGPDYASLYFVLLIISILSMFLLAVGLGAALLRIRHLNGSVRQLKDQLLAARSQAAGGV